MKTPPDRPDPPWAPPTGLSRFLDPFLRMNLYGGSGPTDWADLVGAPVPGSVSLRAQLVWVGAYGATPPRPPPPRPPGPRGARALPSLPTQSRCPHRHSQPGS